MRISFDIDDTLVCPGEPIEPGFPWPRWLFPEKIRRGAPALLRELAAQGWDVWIYTTSRRSSLYLKTWFRALGVRLGGVVNQDLHERVVGRQGPSKLPSAFNIDLHVDDSEGVVLEGLRHGFSVILVSPDDPDWANRVRASIPRRTG